MSAKGNQLQVPYHFQDCPGYCALGCVTMIRDAFEGLGGGYSQVAAYTGVYRTPGTPGNSLPGDYDRWHISPWQLQALLQPLPYEVHQDSGAAGVKRLLEKVRESIEAGSPAIVLLSYDGLASAGKQHASGTHWVVVHGYSTDGTDITGFNSRDPWRGWDKEKENPAFVHKSKPSCCGNDRPAAIASWQRSPFHGPVSPAVSGTILASDLSEGVFGGIRTDGYAYVLTVSSQSPLQTIKRKKEFPMGSRKRVSVEQWPELLHPLFINGIEPDGMASIPPEFAEAMSDSGNPQMVKVERTDGMEGDFYQLTAWPSAKNANRIVAWSGKSPSVMEEELDGAAVLNDQWPRIQAGAGGVLLPKPPLATELQFQNQKRKARSKKRNPPADPEFHLQDPQPDPDWPELDGFFKRLQSFVTDFNAGQITDLTVKRLVWEPCVASLSPAMPFYDVTITLPKTDAESELTFRALIDLGGRIHRRLRRSSKAGG